jgi:hypothetical protein
MRQYGQVSSDAEAPALARGALRALREALARPGRDREAAFALLAADGLLTHAVERYADTEDPETALRVLLALLGEEAGEGSG